MWRFGDIHHVQCVRLRSVVELWFDGDCVSRSAGGVCVCVCSDDETQTHYTQIACRPASTEHTHVQLLPT